MIPLGKLKGPFHTVDRYWEEYVIMIHESINEIPMLKIDANESYLRRFKNGVIEIGKAVSNPLMFNHLS